MLQASSAFYGHIPKSSLPLPDMNDDDALLTIFDCWNDTPEHKHVGVQQGQVPLLPQHPLPSSLPATQAPMVHTSAAPPVVPSGMHGSRHMPLGPQVPVTSAPMPGFYQQHQQAPLLHQQVPQPVPQPLQQLPVQQLPPQPPPPQPVSSPCRHKDGRYAKSPGGSQRESSRAASGRARTTVAAMIEPDSDDGLLVAPAPPSVSVPRVNMSTSSSAAGRASRPGAPGTGESSISMAEPSQRAPGVRASSNSTDARANAGSASGGLEGGSNNTNDGHVGGSSGGAGTGGGGSGSSGGSKGGGSKKGGKGGGSKGPRLVTRTDLRHDLTGRMLKLLWPDDNSWWDGQVASMALDSLQAVIFYSSTGEEEEVSLSEMVDKKELAWPPGESLSTGAGGTRVPRAKSSGSAPKADRKRTTTEAPQTSGGGAAAAPQLEMSKKKARQATPANAAAAPANAAGAAAQGSHPPQPPQPQPQQPQQHYRGYAAAQPQGPASASTLSGAGLASQAIAALMGGTQEGESRVAQVKAKPQPQPQWQQSQAPTSRSMGMDAYAAAARQPQPHPMAMLQPMHQHQQQQQQRLALQQQQQQQQQQQGNGVQQLLAIGPSMVSKRILVYKYPGMNGTQSGWQYATVAGVQNGLLSVMYGPNQMEHLSPANHGIVVRPPPQATHSGW